jgi:TATA-box binding protein (TBP) (component of TFIID and TFIIIB)
MDFVCNANYKGDFGKQINLRQVNIPNSKLYMKPYQLVVKDNKGTLVIFSNGKFRVMGCIDELEASFLAFAHVEKLYTDFPIITLQSYTLRGDVGFPINLIKLSHNVACVYEPELFPALRLKEYKPMCVNIFNTGKVMVCGLRDPEEMHTILQHLKEVCEPYKIQDACPTT